jgi:fimbrial isopeptide formation D2 family protein
MKKILAFLLIALPIIFLAGTPAMADSASSASFQITKTAAPSTVARSSPINFTVSIKNINALGQAQTPQTVVDTLPDGFVFINDSKLTKLDGTQVAFAPSSVNGTVVTWTFAGEFTEAIPQNQNVVISYSATSAANTGVYENNACLTAPENVCAKATITVQSSPVAGLKENIALTSGVGFIAIIFATLLKRKKISFEEAVIASRTQG